jgi:hypothetical protein
LGFLIKGLKEKAVRNLIARTIFITLFLGYLILN